jgi:TrmH family RNA methyltransferase
LLTRTRDREKENAFVVEGVRLAEEAVHSGWLPRLILYTSGLNERGIATVVKFQESGAEAEQISENVLRSVSDTDTPQGILVVLEKKTIKIPERLGFILIIDQMRDPGNLGSILRTAAAAGVDGIFITPGSVDHYSPKVVRAGMGAHFHVPIWVESWQEIHGFLNKGGIQTYLATPEKGIPYYEADFRQPKAIIIGGESSGASVKAYRAAHQLLHIPMSAGVESLNAAAAAAILIFEVVRQRDKMH